jgi:hypothetical protein
MTTYRATPEQWADAGAFASDTRACLLELRARVEALEAAAHKHIVETSANILALASRVEALEAVKCPASKVYEISKLLKLTPGQAQQVRDLLAPNSKPTPNSFQIGRSLVNRVALAISGIEYGLDNWASEARAAIREVAAWMRENECGYNAVRWLEQEAERG